MILTALEFSTRSAMMGASGIHHHMNINQFRKDLAAGEGVKP